MTSYPRATRPEANLSKLVLSDTEINALGFASATQTLNEAVLFIAVIFRDDDFNETFFLRLAKDVEDDAEKARRDIVRAGGSGTRASMRG